MLKDRTIIEKSILTYVESNNMQYRPDKSRKTHALDSFVFNYNNSKKQMVLKSKQQLQIEYSNLIRKLDEKLDTGKLSDIQYDTIFSSLTNLYHTYINELNSQTKIVSRTQESSYQEPQQYSQPETVDKVDEYVEQLRRAYGYYEKNTSEQAMIDQFIYSEIKNDEEEIDKVDGIRGGHRR